MEASSGERLEQVVYASSGSGRLAVRGTAVLTGAGIVAHLFGGEVSHVGSVVVSVPRPSLTGIGETSCTSSVINLIGHKEEGLARPAAETLARALDQPAVVVAGVHVDGATQAEIKELVLNSQAVTEKLIAALGY